MSDNRAQPDPRKPAGFRLWHALVASVLLHLLLVPLAFMLSLARAVTIQAADETVLQFTFDTASDEDETASGADLPALAPLEPLPELPPQIEPEGEPDPPSPEIVPHPAERPKPMQPEIEEPEPETNEPPLDAAESAESAPDLPRDAGDHRLDPADRARPRKSFDVASALQDYGDALSRYREANPPKQQGREQPANVFAPDPQEFPGSGFGFGNLQFESNDYDWNDYARQVLLEIWKAWHRRLHQTVDEFERFAFSNKSWYLNDQCQVRFVIERSGDVAGIELEFQSGWPALDASSTTAMEEVLLPPLPADFPRDRETVRIRFIAIGDVHGMRPTLNYLKRQGRF